MSDAYLGEIRLCGFTFAPRGWAFCDGSLLPINQNQALFALLGTFYGGDGRVTFALPDLRGRIPIGQGSGPGGGARVIGERGGVEQMTLSQPQLPAHRHAVNVFNGPGNAYGPAGHFIAEPNNPGTGSILPAFANFLTTQLNPISVDAGVGNQAHENRPPLLCLNFIIAIQGVFPSRP